jgi:hypothetical protein
MFVISSLGLIWGVYTLPQSEAADEFRDIESRLLRFETFSPPSSIRILDSQAALDLSACDTHAQRAMLLMEIPLAQATLRSGATEAFDRHIQSLEARSRRILSCAPRESFVWLLMFDLAVLHGLLNDHSFDLLAMSYETSPNEAWISIRRITVAMPLVLLAPQFVRKEITSEFQQLITNGFLDNAASAYLTASEPIRSLLQTQIEQLDLHWQQAFLSALRKFHS